MNEYNTNQAQHFTGCASLVAIGVKLNQLKLFDPIRTLVQIKQKTIKHTPTEKLYDAFISLMAGAHGLGGNRYAPANRYGFAESFWQKYMCRAIGGTGDAGCLYRRKCGAITESP